MLPGTAARPAAAAAVGRVPVMRSTRRSARQEAASLAFQLPLPPLTFARAATALPRPEASRGVEQSSSRSAASDLSVSGASNVSVF